MPKLPYGPKKKRNSRSTMYSIIISKYLITDMNAWFIALYTCNHDGCVFVSNIHSYNVCTVHIVCMYIWQVYKGQLNICMKTYDFCQCLLRYECILRVIVTHGHRHPIVQWPLLCIKRQIRPVTCTYR